MFPIYTCVCQSVVLSALPLNGEEGWGEAQGLVDDGVQKRQFFQLLVTELSASPQLLRQSLLTRPVLGQEEDGVRERGTRRVVTGDEEEDSLSRQLVVRQTLVIAFRALLVIDHQLNEIRSLDSCFADISRVSHHLSLTFRRILPFGHYSVGQTLEEADGTRVERFQSQQTADRWRQS